MLVVNFNVRIPGRNHSWKLGILTFQQVPEDLIDISPDGRSSYRWALIGDKLATLGLDTS